MSVVDVDDDVDDVDDVVVDDVGGGQAHGSENANVGPGVDDVCVDGRVREEKEGGVDVGQWGNCVRCYRTIHVDHRTGVTP